MEGFGNHGFTMFADGGFLHVGVQGLHLAVLLAVQQSHTEGVAPQV